MKVSAIILSFAASSCRAFSTPQRFNGAHSHQSTKLYSKEENAPSRRLFLTTAASTAASGMTILLNPNTAYASGGATAGKYTTIPIAKRRYYGRVQEAVHEFLLMAPAVIKGDMTDPTVQVCT